MNIIKVDKQQLIAILVNNRAKHEAIFLEAQAEYREKVIAELDQMLADARDGKKIRRSVTLVEPMNQTKDYDRVIGMLGLSIEPTVELAEHEYAQYVLDDWDWKSRFVASNMSYSTTLRNQSEG